MSWIIKKRFYICTRNKQGTLAQMVEQWTENPCVPGSIPGGTTLKIRNTLDKQGITDFLFLVCTVIVR